MLNAAEKAYCLALQALKRREYSTADRLFDQAAGFFAENQEFRLVRETTRLLVAVKEELGTAESDKRIERTEIEELISYGKENELR